MYKIRKINDEDYLLILIGNGSVKDSGPAVVMITQVVKVRIATVSH